MQPSILSFTAAQHTRPKSRRPAPIPCTCDRVGFCGAHGTYTPVGAEIVPPAPRRVCTGHVVRKKVGHD